MRTEKIYIVWDRKYGILWGVTTDHFKAIAKVGELNSTERVARYTVCTEKDFATIGM